MKDKEIFQAILKAFGHIFDRPIPKDNKVTLPYVGEKNLSKYTIKNYIDEISSESYKKGLRHGQTDGANNIITGIKQILKIKEDE